VRFAFQYSFWDFQYSGHKTTNCVRRACGAKINKKFLVQQCELCRDDQTCQFLTTYLYCYNIQANMVPCFMTLFITLTHATPVWMTGLLIAPEKDYA
jgi:hypothetical protein